MARALSLIALLAAGAIAVVVLTGGGDSEGHRLTATVTEATNVLEGQELKAGGGKIGVVERLEAVNGGQKAKLTLRIEDRAWPLSKGTKFTVRFGGTAAFYNRHILVTPGSASGPALPDGGTIPPKDFTVPVEVDKLLAAFDDDTRRDLKSFINRSGLVLDRSRRDLEQILVKAPPAVGEAAGVMRDLTADRGALDATVRRTDRVVDAVRRADPDLQRLLSGTAQTFDAIAAKQQELRTTLTRMPPMLTQAQGTLRRADATLGKAGSLARRLGPGVKQLRSAAGPINSVLASLTTIGPDARSTLASVRRAAPDLNALLARLTTVTPQLGSIGDKAIENLQCIRPWTPEIIALLMTWGDFMSWNDGKDKILRAQIQHFLPAANNSMPLTPAQAASMYSGMRYGFPRPPGYLAGQPWFQPQCGAGPEALDPSKDQEARER